MSAQTTPLYTMSIPSSEALLKEVTEQLAAVQKAQQQNKRRYQNWKSVANNPQGHDSMMSGNMLFSFLLEGLFGLPFFSGFSEIGQGMAHMGAMQLSDQPDTRKVADPYDLDMTDRAYGKASKHNAAQQKQLEMWQQMTMMLILMMMQQLQQQQGESGSGGAVGPDRFGMPKRKGEDLVPDALRDPKMARFKQNRATISCIRTMFQRQADAVVPRYSAPKYMCA